MERAIRDGWAPAGLAAALALLAVALTAGRDDGALPGRVPGPGKVASPRIVLVGVPGLSWQVVSDAVREGRLPTLSRLARGESARGDLIAAGHASETEILASVVTGRHSFKHRIRDAGGIALLARSQDPARTTVWEWIESRGSRVAAIGFPFGSSETASGGTMGRHELSAGLRPGLLECLASDLATIARAVELLDRDPDRHLFLYLDGLHRWRHRYGATETELAGYYERLDGMLQKVSSAAPEQTTWMLFSERGCTGESVDAPSPPGGFFLAWGRGVRRSVEPLRVSPVDLAVTLAYLSGHPVAYDMDGAVRFDMLVEEHPFQQRLAFRPQRPPDGS